MAREMPVVLNASTTTPEDAARIAEAGSLVMAMHNFYPPAGDRTGRLLPVGIHSRPTGRRSACPGVSPWRRREAGPHWSGTSPPWSVTGTSFPPPALRTWPCDFTWTVSSWATPASARWSRSGFAAFVTRALSPFPPFWNLNIKICMGARLRPGPTPPRLPGPLCRIQNLLLHRRAGGAGQCLPRDRGVITMDNREYGRYSGEIQLIRASLPADPRVNVIGRLPELSLASGRLYPAREPLHSGPG